MIETATFTGTEPGPRVLMLGGIHGNEPCGVVALNHIRAAIESGIILLARGTLVLAPCCNPKAAEQNTRFHDENLNRCINNIPMPVTYEQKLAQQITKLIDNCDILIDFHSTTAPTSPFCFLDQDTQAGRALAAGIGIEKVLLGWPDLYAGQEEYTTQSYAERQGKLALTIECGQHQEEEAITRAERYAMNALSHLKLANIVAELLPSQPTYLKMTRVIFKDHGLSLTEQYPNFYEPRANDIIASNTNEHNILAKEGDVIVMPNSNAKEGEELFYLASRQ